VGFNEKYLYQLFTAGYNTLLPYKTPHNLKKISSLVQAAPTYEVFYEKKSKTN
jgi:hypothetical protein